MNFLKKMLILSLLGGCLCSFPTTGGDARQNADDVSWFAHSSGRALSVTELAESLQECDVIFFGEKHDEPAIHLKERELLEALYQIHGSRLVLSLEMFEADTQQILDDYLAGRCSEEEFLERSRPWPNYRSDYRSLVEFARQHNLAVIAANVPRYLASRLAKTGAAEPETEAEKAWLPRYSDAPPGPYRDKFFNTLTGMGGRGAPMQNAPERLENMFKAQCLKDDKMAESLYNYLQAVPSAKILHINGSFHSDGHLGTVERLAQRAPGLRLRTIAPRSVSDRDGGEKAASAARAVTEPADGRRLKETLAQDGSQNDYFLYYREKIQVEI